MGWGFFSESEHLTHGWPHLRLEVAILYRPCLAFMGGALLSGLELASLRAVEMSHYWGCVG
jgi:hypothetical protein